MTPLEEAQQLAARHRLKVVPRRTSSGAVRCWLLYRDTLPRLTYIGERCNEKALLALVKSASKSE